MPGEVIRGRTPSTRLSISAVIATRNRRETLAQVLDRLSTIALDEVVVVDNGSDDGTPDFLRNRDSAIRLLELGENAGVAARNAGARLASGDLLLMLDDDSYPTAGAVETLAARFAADSRLAVAGGFVRDVDGDGRVVRQPEEGTFDWWLRAGRRGGLPSDGLPAFFFPEGACLIRRDAFLEVGGYFEPYFHAALGIDLATRLLARGWDVRYFPGAVFDHLKAPGGGRARRDVALYHRIRNNLWYLWRHFPARLAVPRTFGYLAFDLADAAYHGVPHAWLRAVRDAWVDRDVVRTTRAPLPPRTLRRAELNRGRMHARFLLARFAARVSGARR